MLVRLKGKAFSASIALPGNKLIEVDGTALKKTA